MDLIKNVDYQVVLKYDIDNAVAYLWVNPASENDTANWSGPTSDLGAAANGLAGLLFRQRTGGGTVDVRDVVVGTSFADVMTNTTCSPVMVATNYNMVTNYEGNPALLEVFASSIGGGPLSYQWYQIRQRELQRDSRRHRPDLPGAQLERFRCRQLLLRDRQHGRLERGQRYQFLHLGEHYPDAAGIHHQAFFHCLWGHRRLTDPELCARSGPGRSASSGPLTARRWLTARL